MPEPRAVINWGNERVVFENWAVDGTHIFVDHKHVLTLATPESSKCDEAYRAYIEDWISPDEYCERLTAVLSGLGASSAMVAQVEQERQNYRQYPVEPPMRTHEDLLREATAVRE